MEHATETGDTPATGQFGGLGISSGLAQGFLALGFSGPTDIQSLAIPALVKGGDCYISAATGTGKTFAYAAPVLSAVDPDSRQILAIVVTPTHDLAAQIEREILRLSDASGAGVRVALALGSIPLRRQMDRLADKPHIVVGSAGRLRDLAANGVIDLGACRWAVLDEADRLFENEAIDMTGELLAVLPENCSRILVSASLPERTLSRSAPWFRNPQKLVIDPAEALRTTIEHWVFHASSRSKLDFLRRFEASVKPERCLLFASSNATIFNIQKRLDYLGFPAVVLKSDREGSDRQSALSAFARGDARWLITTDLGARGLDIADITHVISFDLPEEPTVYLHRAGRTGRAGKRGVSVALADLVELKRASKVAVRYGFPFICKVLDSGVVHDIEPDNFFALAEEDEAARKNVKLERAPGRLAGGTGRTRPVGRYSSPGADAAAARTSTPGRSQSSGRNDRRDPDVAQGRRDTGTGAPTGERFGGSGRRDSARDGRAGASVRSVRPDSGAGGRADGSGDSRRPDSGQGGRTDGSGRRGRRPGTDRHGVTSASVASNPGDRDGSAGREDAGPGLAQPVTGGARDGRSRRTAEPDGQRTRNADRNQTADGLPTGRQRTAGNRGKKRSRNPARNPGDGAGTTGGDTTPKE